jgi:hypothetical protein
MDSILNSFRIVGNLEGDGSAFDATGESGPTLQSPFLGLLHGFPTGMRCVSFSPEFLFKREADLTLEDI